MTQIGIVILGLIGIVSIFLLLALPGIILFKLWARFSSKIENQILNIVIKAGLLAIAIAPSPYITIHSGVEPAIWMVFSFTGFDRWKFGILPILIFWGISAFWLIRKNRKNSPS